MYFINDNIIDVKRSGIKEGGVVRNIAWIKFLQKHRTDVKLIDLPFSGRATQHLNFLKYLIFAATVKNDRVFALYPKVGLPVLGTGVKGNLFRKLYLSSLNRMIRRGNQIIFDVSDIKYEQAIDLELDNLDMEEIKAFEAKLFTSGQKFIFASHAMRDYAVETHGIPRENTDVCVNGGYLTDPELVEAVSLPEGGLRFVYAGTLNKGRMVEQMIDSFPECQDRSLILLGISGQWIPAYLEERGRKNVFYLGAYEESVARKIVAACHVGMIPYDDSRKYYNIAYPTKLSFYITAGIPYLATPVAEVNRVQREHDLGFTAPVTQWNALVSGMDRNTVDEKKEKVKKHRAKYTWEQIFSENSLV